MASSAIAAAATSSITSTATPSRGLQATAMRKRGACAASLARAMNLFGAAHERIDESVGDAIEHRADRRLQDGVGKRIAHLELDLAGRALARAGQRQGDEAPEALEERERPVDEADVDRLVRHQGVPGRERVADARVGEMKPGDQALRLAAQHLDPLAPGQEVRIGLDVDDELVDLVRRVPEEHRLLDVLHTIAKL